MYFRIPRLYIFIILSCTFWPVAIKPQECGDKVTKVYYLNGVWNTPIQALFSKNLVRHAYEAELAAMFPDETFEFALLYNDTTTERGDLREVFRQKILESGAQLDAFIVALDAIDVIQNTSKRLVADRLGTLGIPQALVESLLQTFAQESLEPIIQIDNELKFFESLKDDLNQFTRVLIIAHSQGNLFGNSTARELRSQLPEHLRAIAVLGVASPAATNDATGDYFTAKDDRAINGLRLLADVLPGNVDNDPGIFSDDRDTGNHAFNESYFTPGLQSRSAIDDEFFHLVEILEFYSIQGFYQGTFDGVLDGEPITADATATITGVLNDFSVTFNLGGIVTGGFPASGSSFTASWEGFARGSPAQGTTSCVLAPDIGPEGCAVSLQCTGSGFNENGDGSGSTVYFRQ